MNTRTEVVTVDGEQFLRTTKSEDSTREQVERQIEWLQDRIDKYTPKLVAWEAEKADLKLNLRDLPEPERKE